MVITVEMTAEVFEEFRRFQKECEYAAGRIKPIENRIKVLCDKILMTLDQRENGEKVTYEVDQDQADDLWNMALDWGMD